ncbi:MAG: hypothetical protein Q4C56_00045 [Peptococcaceae bacterium]|nr:hypothetical protein [Peptococcaceae bacterium]
MKDYRSEIMALDSRRLAKQFIFLSACVMILGGCVLAALYWPQIQAAAQYVQQAGIHPYLLDDDWLEAAVGTPSLLAQAVTAGLAVIACAWLGAYWLLVAAGLYQAAERRAMNGPLWLALGLLGNLAAVALFALVCAQTRTACPACGASVGTKDGFCGRCGAKQA